MADESSDEDKTEEASAHKLAEARKKGDVAKSPDLPQALSLIGACAVVILAGPALSRSLAEKLVAFIDHPYQMLMALESDGGLGIATALIYAILPLIMLILGVALILGVGGHVMQTGLMFSTEKLKPNFKFLNPLAGLKRIYGVDSLIQFAKTVLKLVVTAYISYMILKDRVAGFINLTHAGPEAILPAALEVFKALALAVCIFLLAGGGFDYLLQRFRFMQKMRMSKQEVKDEYKQQEGDPHVKAQLRALRIEKSRRRMMANVAKATVVITNPTHYAVALSYGDEVGAPVCVAKGMDAVALKIREEAKKHDITIVEDPPLARALYATTEIDDIIPEAHFAAVAKIIGFILSRKKRGF